jgi:RNA polymerase sigma-70 factor, ECF subfamily
VGDRAIKEATMKLRDPEAFQSVFATHSRRVYANAYKILGDTARAEDVVQDVFLRLWLHSDRFDPARGELGSYLAMMARSRALDLARSEAAATRAGDRLTATVEADPPRVEPPDERVARSDHASRVRAAVAALPRPQREAVALAFWAGLPARDIADRTGVPLGTARSRLRLGLEKLERSAVAEGLKRNAVVGLAHP